MFEQVFYVELITNDDNNNFKNKEKVIRKNIVFFLQKFKVYTVYRPQEDDTKNKKLHGKNTLYLLNVLKL